MTKQEALDRIELLSDEIDANEEENCMMEKEIESLYAMIEELEGML
jgi:FtsZ-binding cell division protein ZapB